MMDPANRQSLVRAPEKEKFPEDSAPFSKKASPGAILNTMTEITKMRILPQRIEIAEGATSNNLKPRMR